MSALNLIIWDVLLRNILIGKLASLAEEFI